MSTLPPALNTHVHLPPNFSAFDTAEDAVAAAAAEGSGCSGRPTSTTSHLPRFAEAATAAGIVPLFGLEIISVVDALRDAGTKVNDPGNPGRMYLCGKGINPFAPPTPTASRLAAQVRAADTVRMDALVPLVAARFTEAGVDTALTAERIAEDVADRAGVPRAWVVLQERHLAMAFQEALFLVAAPAAAAGPARPGVRRPRRRPGGRPDRRPGRDPLAADEGGRAGVRAGVAGLLRRRLPAGPRDWAASPATPRSPTACRRSARGRSRPRRSPQRVLERGIHAAELIPIRNRPDVVDAYVAAFRDGRHPGHGRNRAQHARAHPARAALRRRVAAVRQPRAQAFWEATCVVAAHQHLRASGRPGYVDREGRLDPGFPTARRASAGSASSAQELIGAASPVGAR